MRANWRSNYFFLTPLVLLGGVALLHVRLTSAPNSAGSSQEWLLAAGLAAEAPAALPQDSQILVGFTAFPYDLTAEAEGKTHEIILPATNLYAIHMDQCLPWRQALKGEPFPAWLERDWDQILARIPQTHTVYVAITATAMDRRNFAAQCGPNEESPGRMPPELSGRPFDHPDVKKAYANYARRVVEKFKPAYVNIGIEISEMALQKPALWRQYERLFYDTYDRLKLRFPDLSVGMEFVLQSMLLPRVAEAVKPSIARSDYMGVSFYPYGSEFGVKMGAPALPEGDNQWKQPLDWLKQYSPKPIAICETGYTTKQVRLPSAGLTFNGNPQTQTRFLQDLIAAAKRDNYLFVVWFVPIDYERLLDKLKVGEEKNIWVNTGLYGADLQPKPAWPVWMDFFREQAAKPLRQSTVTREGDRATISASEPGPETAEARTEPDRPSSGILTLGFQSDDDLFTCSEGGKVSLDREAAAPSQEAMRWNIHYQKDWVLCHKDVHEGRLSNATSVSFSIRSDRVEYVLFRLDERGGKTYHAFVPVEKEWRPVHLKLDQLAKGQSEGGTLQTANVGRIWLGDGGAEDGATGDRTIWISSIEFK